MPTTAYPLWRIRFFASLFRFQATASAFGSTVLSGRNLAGETRALCCHWHGRKTRPKYLLDRAARTMNVGVLDIKSHAGVELVVIPRAYARQPQRDVVAVRIEIEGVNTHVNVAQPRGKLLDAVPRGPAC